MPSLTLILFCIFLAVAQGLAALPWLLAVDLRSRQAMKQWQPWAWSLGVCVALGAGMAFYLDLNSDRSVLGMWGRLYMALLHIQLGADLLVVLFLVMLLFWSKGGAVALAAFREGMRQPMFWMLGGFACFLMLISPFLPYFTFGEDLKMVKELCFAFTMMAALFFGVVSASLSVHEEIEGRTAVTLMSKPISRRQFLLGKFVGILLSALAMTMMMGWVLVWVVLFKEHWDSNLPGNQQVADPPMVTSLSEEIFEPGASADLVRGIALWINDAWGHLPMLVLGFCQVMVMIAIAVALATRLPMVVNVPLCLVIYFLGHLTPIMTEVTRTQFALVYFMAQLFETVLPGLDLFDVGSAIIRDLPLPPWQYLMYTLNVAFYAIIYTSIALLLGLILFEDRDLA